MIDRKSMEQIRLFNQEPPSRHARAMLKEAGLAAQEDGLYLLQLLEWAVDSLNLDRAQAIDLRELWDRLNRAQYDGQVREAYRFLTGDDGTGGMATAKFEAAKSPQEAARRLANLALSLLPQ